jgi:hypothetical protein
VAWTSDATGRWANDWVTWDGFPTYWSSVVRWTVSQNRDSSVETAVTFSGEDATLTVDARGSSGSYLNNLQMEANVISPEGATVNLTLRQVAPGRYEAPFTPEQDGAYFIRVAGTAIATEGGDDDDTVIGQTSGWVLGYSPEYQQLEADAHLLTTIADLTNGRNLGIFPTPEQQTAAIIAHDLPSDRATRPIWPFLTLLAVMFLPFDIAVRRLVITRRDMEKAWAATFGRFTPEVMVPADRTDQIGRLFQAKKRAGVEKGEDTAVLEPQIIQRKDAIEQPEPIRTKPATTQRQPPTPATSGSALASRLLEKKRQQSNDRKEDS